MTKDTESDIITIQGVSKSNYLKQAQNGGEAVS